MRLHILGICGKFMAGLAVLAKQSGHSVTGSDANVYPPMSTQLREQGITLIEGYDPAHIDPEVDCVIVGNVISRGNPALEFVLDSHIPYVSGPEWLAQHILQDRWVLAVAGTHGKTTTTSLLAWILEYAGLKPGFMIGGVPGNFGVSARLGECPFFVIEADEYDSAFFDKRSKFIHYHPKTLIMNNLEYDHADIFPDLAAIVRQFHYLVRTVPSNGRIIRHAQDHNLTDVLEQGAWTPVVSFGAGGEWQGKLLHPDGSYFEVELEGRTVGTCEWALLGQHNVENALAALAAATHAGVPAKIGLEALATFKNVKCRMEIKGRVHGVTVYDDFAHHPTAIATTIAGLRARVGEARILAVLECGSYTMRTGVHQATLAKSLSNADRVFCLQPAGQTWDLSQALAPLDHPAEIRAAVPDLVNVLASEVQAGDHVLVMSNSAFGGLHAQLLERIETHHAGN